VSPKKSDRSAANDHYFDDPIEEAPQKPRRNTKLFSSLTLLLGTVIFFQNTFAALDL
jgi:hypothetical protein